MYMHQEQESRSVTDNVGDNKLKINENSDDFEVDKQNSEEV